MVVQSADQAIANAKKTTTNDVGMCLWYTQEWCQTPHQYPDATAQWNAAKYKHPGDTNPPAGAPLSWTGGSAGHGHSALSLGGGKCRSIDQQSSGKTSDVPISEIAKDWGLTYKGWHEDLGGVRLPYLTGGSNPGNPNGIKVGDTALVTANGSLNGRASADAGATVVTTAPYGSAFPITALQNGWAQGYAGAWYSTDYLYPKVLPNPTNPNGVKKGDTVTVTASGTLKARQLPGGPQSTDKNGDPLTRPNGYSFSVTGDLVDGWVTGGTNWYSSDYLAPVTTPPPNPGPPSWGSTPKLILDDPTPDPNRNVSYLQAVVRVAGMTATDGTVYPELYLLAQDLENKGNLRFAALGSDGMFGSSWMMVNDAGHGQTFHAYRSAAGNLYLWCGENPAYRYAWQYQKTVSRSSGTKMDYKGCRPVGSHEPWVGFRDATDTTETFYLFDRSDFTDGTNRTTPAKTCKISKQTKRSQQSWAVTADRIYRISGSTNNNPPNGSMLHVLEVFDWSGARLLELDVTKMAISTTSDEPEGITFTGTPGSVLLGKREGSTDPAKRSYPLWAMTGLP